MAYDHERKRKWDQPWRRIMLIVGFLGGGGLVMIEACYKFGFWGITALFSGTFETVSAHNIDQARQDKEIDLKLRAAILESANVFWDTAEQRGLVRRPVFHRRKDVELDPE